MPRQILKINQFEGGINSGTAEKDISKNQLTEATNHSLHRVGSLKLLGEFIEHEATLGTDVGQELTGGGALRFVSNQPGYGLFSFQSDYKMLNPDNGFFLTGTSSQVGASKYLLLYNTDNGASAAIFQNVGGTLDWSDDGSGSEIDLGGATADLVYYSYNGAVRIADASGTASNITQWLGVISPKIYGHVPPESTYTSATSLSPIKSLSLPTILTP